MEAEVLFWSIAEDLLSARVEEGTMMGHRCLRADGDFAAMFGRKEQGLIVKLSADRVQQLITDGTGHAFAPAGKVFREWILIPTADEATWRSLMTEAVAGSG